MHAAVYCGMPKAINATFVAKKVFMERQLLPDQDDVLVIALLFSEHFWALRPSYGELAT